MFRLISILLLLAGLAVAGFGALRMTGGELPISVIRGEPAPPPSPVAEAPPTPVAASEPVSVQPAPPPPPPEPIVEAEAAPEPVIEAIPAPVMAERSLEVTEPALKPDKGSDVRKQASRSLGSPDMAPEPQPVETVDAPMPAPVEAATSPDPIAQPEAMMRVETAPPPAPQPSLMDQLRAVPIAHETPAEATFGRPFSVTMAINSAEGATTATEALPGTGNVVEAEAQVSDTVRAIVAGEAFTVEAVSPATQKLSPLTENVWRWSVTPLKAGPQELVIEIYAVDEGEALPVRTFRDTVTVEVSRFGQAIALAQEANPLIMVLAGIGSIFAGLFGAARFFRGR